MKGIKVLGSLIAAVMVMMAVSASATAVILYENPGDPLDPGDTTHSVSEGTMSIDGSVQVSCKTTTHGTLVQNGATIPPDTRFPLIAITSQTAVECGKDTVTSLKGGTLSIGSGGSVTSSGAEITVQLHRTVLGFPVTTHCIYATNSTSVGTLQESSSTGGTAKLNIGSSPVPEVATDGACGNDAVWTGSYSITSPDFLDFS